ncbi:MAG: sigma-54-dependent Fis family transcriptional regulator [Candidatus Helarchaeota archaeon]|nr:sigma-54-dependent Fis family transcriptional regulator [Candidatus Helarchaeota archaeon]
MSEKPKILIVDDEMIMRDSLTAWLEEDDFNPITAESGMQALEILDKDKPEVILLDIKMPRMDGITLLKKLKEKYEDIPVVIITAYATVENAVESMKEGAYDYVMKPFPPEKISYLLKRIIEHQKLIKENIRLQEEKKTFLHIVVGIIVSIIILFTLFYFIFK